MSEDQAIRILIVDAGDGVEAVERFEAERLQAQDGTSAAISLDHLSVGQGGCLKIRIKDSGDGFDSTQLDKIMDTATTLPGRGVGLVKNPCLSLIFRGNECDMEAIFEWL